MINHNNFNPGQPAQMSSQSTKRIGKSGAKHTMRAVCRVVLNGMEAGKKYIEKSLDYFHSDGRLLKDKSIIIIDKQSKELFMESLSQSKNLYDRLTDIGVIFVDVENKTHDIHQFIKRKLGNDSLKTVIDLFRNIPLPLSDFIDYTHFRSEAYQLICPSYAYSLDKSLKSVAVIDADSFAPLDGGRKPDSIRKSPMPISLKGRIELKKTNKPDPMKVDTVYDFEFLNTVNGITQLSRLDRGFLVKLYYDMSFAFREINSKAAADDLASSVLDSMKSHALEPKWLVIKPPKPKVVTLDSIIQSALPIERLCYLSCNFIDEYSPIICPKNLLLTMCCNSHKSCQSVLLEELNKSYILTLLKSLKNFVRKNPTFTLCLDRNVLRNAHGISECQYVHGQAKKGENLFFKFPQFPSGFMVKQGQLSNLAPLFSSPRHEWGFYGTEAYYLWDETVSFSQPVYFHSVGKEHAMELLGGNLIVNTSLIQPIHPPPGGDRKSIETNNTHLDGFKYGVASGLLDELMDRTRLQDSRCSLVYNMAKGYLFGQVPGCILATVSSSYCQWLEPRMVEGKLKTFLGYTVPRGFLLASVVQNPMGAACSFIGYQASRTLIQKVSQCWQTTSEGNDEARVILADRHNVPRHRKKHFHGRKNVRKR